MSPIKQFLSIMALTCMWSPSFLFIKLGLQSLFPFGLVAARVGLASLLLLVILALRSQSMPRDTSFWKHMSMMALLASVVPFSLFSYAGQRIDSSVLSMINALSPVFTVILSFVLLPNERLSLIKVFGIALSLLGLFWLLGPGECFVSAEMTYGTMAACLASFSYGLSHVYAKKFTIGKAPFVAPAAQMSLSFLMLLPLVTVFEGYTQFVHASLTSIMGIVCLAVLGTVLAFSLYYKLLETCGATAISMVACFFPIGGMCLGALFLNERITMEQIFAAVLILTGGMIVNEVITFNIRPKKTTSS